MEHGVQAVKDGYQIRNVPQLLIYWQQKNVFADFIAKFCTLKQKYSGIPENIKNKDNFIKEIVDYILNVFAIKIAPSEIHFQRNDGMKVVMKPILNSLWGKFCQRNSTTHTSFVTDAEELWMAFSNKQYESVHMNKMDSGTMRLTCKTKPSYVNPNKFTSLAIACHVTCFTRLELLKKLRQLPDDSILYFDMDSIIHHLESRKPLIQGFKLGEMVSELSKNEHITSFCSTGYTYTTNLQHEITHVKGFKITNKLDHISANSIYQTLANRKQNLKQIISNKITITNKLDIKHEKSIKTFTFTFDKQSIDNNNFKTYPWGY